MSTTDGDELPEHVAENRRLWDAMADEWVAGGERAWRSEAPTWGVWQVHDSELHLLPDDMTGMRAIELGCGTGYFSAWMARRGAEVVAIDNSARQLETARRLATEHGLSAIEWVHGNAEVVDAPDGSFDYALSEYGVAIWADPEVWLPEAARILRSGGELVFLGNSPFSMLTLPLDGSPGQTDTLMRPYFGMDRLDWREAEVDPGGVEFNRPISGWVGLFGRVGFEIIAYHEPRPSDDATGERFQHSADWAKRYPTEQIWHLRRR